MKLVCSCGASFPVSAEEADLFKDNEFRCPKCKAQSPASAAKRKAGSTAQVTAPATKKPKSLWNLMSNGTGAAAAEVKGGDEIEGPVLAPGRQTASTSPKPPSRSTFVPKPAATSNTPPAPAPVVTPLLATPPTFPVSRQQRKPFVRRAVLSAVAILLAALLFYGGSHLLSKTSAVNNPVLAKILPDPDKAAVEEWLRMNLDDPNWTEVRWWPAKEIIKQQVGKIPARVCRLRFRSKNPLGAMMLWDEIFIIQQDGKVKKYSYPEVYLGEFPD